MASAHQPLPARLEPRAVPSRARITYAFELFAVEGVGGRVASRVFGLPLNPQEYDVREIAAAEVTPTAGGIAAEEAGFLLREITIRGTAGTDYRPGWSAGTVERAGQMIYDHGHQLFEELQQFLALYGRLKADLSTTGAVALAWHDFIRDKHWIVIPMEIHLPRSAERNRMHREYQIRLKAVADYESQLRNFFDDGTVGDVRRSIEAGLDHIDQITGYVEDARAYIDEGNRIVRGLTARAVGSVDRLLGAVTGVRNGVAETIALPRETWREVTEGVARWRAGLTDLISDLSPDAPEGLDEGVAFDPLDRAQSRDLAALEVAAQLEAELHGLGARPDLWGPSWEAQANARSGQRQGAAAVSAAVAASAAATPTPGSLSSRATAGTSRRAPSDARRGARATRRYTGQRRYTVRAGDTLQGIASREMGAADLWLDLADANPALRAPYISVAGLPGTVAPGDILFVPTIGGEGDSVRANGPALAQSGEDALLGVDFALDDEGEWSADPARGSTDVRTVGGLENYTQAIEKIRLRTQIGGNLIYPHVGILAPIGRAAGVHTPEAVAVSVRAAIGQDPRTEEIEAISLTSQGDGLSVQVEFRPIGGTGRRTIRQPVD